MSSTANADSSVQVRFEARVEEKDCLLEKQPQQSMSQLRQIAFSSFWFAFFFIATVLLAILLPERVNGRCFLELA